MLRGFCPPRELAECDLVRHLEALLTGLSIPSCSDDDLLSSDDEDSTFTRLLLRRIGMQPLLSDVEFSFTAAEKHIVATVDQDDLTDLITYILEDLVGIESDAITLKLNRDNKDAIITLRGTGATASDAMKKGGGFLMRLCDRMGGTLSCSIDGNGRQYSIRIGGLI